MSNSYISSLEETHYDYARQHLGETEIIREDSIKEIQEWIQNNPQFKANDDAISILYFLRGCKFDISKTKSKLQQFYSSRAKVPEWFKNRDPHLQELNELLDLGVFLPLKCRDSQNRLVVIIRVAAHDPQKHTQDNVFKIGQMILDLALYLDEIISIYGVKAIFDLENVTLGHALQLPPHMIKKAVDSWKCYPTMIKGLHFVNAPNCVNVVLSVFKRFMGKKLRERITIHKDGLMNIADLPKECLTNHTAFFNNLAQHWKEQLHLYRNWLMQDTSKQN